MKKNGQMQTCFQLIVLVRKIKNRQIIRQLLLGACYSAPASIFMKIHEKEKSLRRPELTLEDLLYVGIYRKGSKIQINDKKAAMKL